MHRKRGLVFVLWVAQVFVEERAKELVQLDDHVLVFGGAKYTGRIDFSFLV